MHGLPYLWSTWESARAGWEIRCYHPRLPLSHEFTMLIVFIPPLFPLCHLPSSPSTRDTVAGKAQVPKGHEQDACCLPCHTTVCCFDDAWSGSVTKSYWAVLLSEHGVKTDHRKVVLAVQLSAWIGLEKKEVQWPHIILLESNKQK